MTVKKGINGTGIPSSVQNVVVKLSGMPAAATVDLAALAAGEAGAIATSGTTIITPYTVSSSESTTVVEASIAPHSGTAGRTLTFTAGGKDWTCTLPGTFAFEAGKIYALDATLNGEKTATADGETNCFIATTYTDLTFPVSRAYDLAGDTLRTGGAYTAGFEAAVVWEETDVINGTPTVTGTGNTAKVTVKTNWGFPGNALVKIFKAADAGQTPVWSYHIWVTDYDPDVNTWTNNGFIFMDRNLGATEAALSPAARGLYYEWGRKDPFSSAIPITNVASSATVGTIVYTIQNPDKFITGNSSSDYDWFFASRSWSLWGHNAAKTIYDPCPAGWRIPVNSSSSPWLDMTNPGYTESDSGGLDWSSPAGSGNAFYPAAGFRNTYGGFTVVGRSGQYWSASINPYDTRYSLLLRFQADRFINVSYTDNRYQDHTRASGSSARCVRE
jgi:hypothetical protein